ncbi:PDZ domain-containing protein [Candidatus Poribacteria bacterium]|nr:PDZ domain-containing protein [Candidatus Poribacteria bacterium]
MGRRLANVLLLVAVTVPFPLSAARDWTEDIARFKPSVVNIERSAEVVFESESQGTSYATGFVVDGARGIIATNRHVTGVSPAYVKVNFYDGSFTEAHLLYYDPIQDFGFYKIDPEQVGFELQQVSFESWRNLSVGDELLMVGNNEKEEYSIKTGAVTNLIVNKGDRHGAYLHTTFDRTGGSSGSPVWNARGNVVAIHAAGTDTSSFELPSDYLTTALKQLQAGERIARGDTGADLELISIGEAIRHYRLPGASAAEIGPSMTGGTPHVIQIEGIIPQTPSAGLLQPGDIIYRADGKLLRDDLFLYDRILDDYVGSTVAMEVYRNGELLRLDVPVFDLETGKLRRFARFAGGIFHDLSLNLRHQIHIEGDGGFMPFAVAGSSFSRAGVRDRNGNSKVLIIELNGVPVRSLDDLVNAARTIPSGLHTYVVAHDYNLYDSSAKPRSLTLNLQYGPLEVFTWDEPTLDWVPEGEPASQSGDPTSR